MKRFLLSVFVVCVVAWPGRAGADLLAVDLAQNHVDITAGFNGADLVLFGVQDVPGDIAVTITGPFKEMTVRRKEKIGGIWMNREWVNFENVPSFYDFATTGGNINPALLKENLIGLDSLRFAPKRKMKDAERLKEFQDALVRNKQAKNLFPTEGGEINFIREKFFRTEFSIPSNVSTGTFTVTTYLFQNGKLKDVKKTDLKVAQVGNGARIFAFAKEHSLIYGILCALFAMIAGWTSNSIRNRLR